nr:immunoglobulin heavy chain junction region [Mus musculus]
CARESLVTTVPFAYW